MPPDPTASVPEMVESVVVATHEGTPETRASTWPLLPAVVVASAPVPLPRTTAPEATFPHPVPPFAVPRIPLMSDVRLMRAVATTPAVAFKNPLTCPKVKVFDATRFEVEATVVTLRLVVVALVIVATEASKATKCEVEDAKIPLCAQMVDEVAAVVTP